MQCHTVIHFNRKPTLVVAACRRIFGIPCAAFFDDILRVDRQVVDLQGVLFRFLYSPAALLKGVERRAKVRVIQA